MGNDSSKKGNSSRGGVNSAEAAALEELFRNMNSMKPGQLAVRWDSLLDRFLTQRIINYIAPKSNAQNLVVSQDRFRKFFEQLVQGSAHDGSPILYDILTGSTHQETIPKKTVIDYVKSLVLSYLLSWPNSGWDSNGDQVKADALLFARSLCNELASEANVDQFGNWLASTPKVISLQNAILSRLHPYNSSQIQLHPKITNMKARSLLTLPSVVFVNNSLPSELRLEWRLLYTTQTQGESFSKLLECILRKGPTILVAKDKGGAVFGGYGPVAWSMGPKFFGDSSSFLFRLRPDASVEEASGFNGNYQYLNMGQQTMPNGLGYGGKLEYFGLWLDAQFGVGQSNVSCTTYRNHRTLSTDKEFTLDALEVWAVGPEEVVEEEQGKRSVLDSNTEAKAMLEMLGKKTHSDGYREPEVDT